MYNYQEERPKLFTEDAQASFIKVRDTVFELLEVAGAFRILKPFSKTKIGDSWTMMAYIDRLVELGEIKEVTGFSVRGQDRVFVDNR